MHFVLIKPVFSDHMSYVTLFQGLGLWCLMPLSTIFQLHHGVVLLVEEPEYLEKTNDVLQVTD